MKINKYFLIVALLVMVLAVWGPEVLARYKDRTILDKISVEDMESGSEGYRYSLSSNAKLYIVSKCLNNQIQPESELSSMTRQTSADVDYEELTGAYAFVINHKGPSDMEITDEEIYETCNRGMDTLKELSILPDTVKKIEASSYTAALYSAIDVLEPRNNVSVWKVSLATSRQNANKENRLIEAYIDADTGKLYEFYVRAQIAWEDIDPDEIIRQWSAYMGLGQPKEYESANPLTETTPYFKKYSFDGMEDSSTIVTIGFYEGINEIFLKISK